MKEKSSDFGDFTMGRSAQAHFTSRGAHHGLSQTLHERETPLTCRLGDADARGHHGAVRVRRPAATLLISTRFGKFCFFFSSTARSVSLTSTDYQVSERPLPPPLSRLLRPHFMYTLPRQPPS